VPIAAYDFADVPYLDPEMIDAIAGRLLDVLSEPLLDALAPRR
jgi:hypothetical protein